MLPDPIFLNVHMYGVMIAVGILCAFGVLTHYGKRLGVESRIIDFFFYALIASIALGFGAAALVQAFYNYLEHPELGFQLGGMTFIGGLIGGAAAFFIIYFIFRRRMRLKLTGVLGIIPCGILVAHGFGRIGCFFAGCCYGKATDCFLGVQFPHLPGPVHPTQLYEAAFLFLFFGLCSWLLLKKGFRHNLSLYLIGYGVFRFIIEYLRGDDRGHLVSFLSPSQFWSVFMVAGGIALIFVMRRIYSREAAHEDVL